MRAARILRQFSADPITTHVGDRSQFWKKVREALVVNPEIGTGSPIADAHRWPQPASRPETFVVPTSKASDVAQNPYFQRDFRRQYPKTEVVTQDELALLLVSQGGFTSLPAPATSSTSEKALTADSPAPSLSTIYSSTAAASFKPPVPPGPKYKWSTAVAETIPSGEHSGFPLVAYGATLVKA
ncbi:hypothetical protein T439DRAFT_327826 [Meredithblackwellia eburnea MCA 4105]